MYSTISATQIINIVAIVTIVIGAILLVMLISRTYLNSIFEHIDSIPKAEPKPRCVPESRLPLKNGLIYRASKRAFDLVFAIVTLWLVCPLMLVMALAIKLSSPGPIFFIQNRVGKAGKVFGANKFRTLKIVSDDKDFGKEAARQLAVDPRVTNIGRFLRRTSLDELPMLFNVLFGDMSIVGTSAASDYRLEDDFVSKVRDSVLSVKPGIISLWALSGSHWRFDVDTRISYDLYYVTHQSFILDLSVILMAIPSVFGRVGSY